MLTRPLLAFTFLLGLAATPVLAQAPGSTPAAPGGARTGTATGTMPTLPNPHPTGVPGAASAGMDHQNQPAGHLSGQNPNAGRVPTPPAGTGQTP